MAIQIVCNRENDLCENKKQEEQDEREGYNASGGEEERREDKADKREEAASIGLYTRCGCGQERESGRSSFFGAGRTTSCPVARCHPALPLPLRSDWQDRPSPAAIFTCLYLSFCFVLDRQTPCDFQRHVSVTLGERAYFCCSRFDRDSMRFSKIERQDRISFSI